MKNALASKLDKSSNPNIDENRIWNKIESNLKTKSNPFLLWYKIGIAASIVFLIGLSFVFNKTPKNLKNEISINRNLPLKNESVQPPKIISKPLANDFMATTQRKVNSQLKKTVKIEFTQTKEKLEPITRTETIVQLPIIELCNLSKETKIVPISIANSKPKFRTINEDEYNLIEPINQIKPRSFVFKLGTKQENIVENNSIIFHSNKSN